MVFPIRGADGVFRPFLTRINPVRDHDGKIVRWFGTNTDVDAMQRAQAAIRASEERFRHLAESMPQVVWTAVPDGACDYINQRWTELTGCDLAATQSGVFRKYMLQEDLDALDRAANEGVQKGLPYAVECRFRRQSDGTLRWYLVRSVPVRNMSGEIIKWFGTSTDIDEQKRTEEELRHANHDLESFAYSASHDLQEPLRMISIYSQMLIRKYGGDPDDETSRCVKYITDGTARMRQLLADLLAYTQMNSRDHDAEVIDLNVVLQKALGNLTMLIKESDAVVTHESLPIIRAHPGHLLQLFQNLIGNSIKYRGTDSPRIHISVAESNDGWRLAVADNGVGIAPDYHHTVFGIFKRLHGNTVPGTGIGLAICKRVVERHGGRIWVQSDRDQGATFYFTIPNIR